MRLLLVIVTLALVGAGCQATSKPPSPGPTLTGPEVGAFYKDEPGTGVRGAFDLAFDTAVVDPRDTIVLIFNDGTDAIGKDGTCRPGNTPKFIRDWGTSGIAGHDVVVFYLCSDVVETTSEVLGQRRAEEDKDLLDRLKARGVPAQHIFILGHSSGASAALLAAGQAPGKLNAAIVAAPGYGYAYAETQDRSEDERQMLETLNETWRDSLAGLRDMKALIYLFEGDTLTPPEDAMFLADHPGVEVILVHAVDDSGALCADGPEPHFYWWSACFKQDGKQVVEQYIVERLAAADQASS